MMEKKTEIPRLGSSVNQAIYINTNKTLVWPLLSWPAEWSVVVISEEGKKKMMITGQERGEVV